MSFLPAGRARLLITALVTAAGLSACGPHSSPAAGTPSSPAAGAAARSSSQATASAASTTSRAAPVAGINVCSLLTPAQASAINKVTYGAGTLKQVTAGWEQCEYPNKGSVDPVDIQRLEVGVIAIAGCWEQLKATLPSATPISGLGDAAVGYPIGLLVRTGSTCVQIQALTHAELNGDHSRDEAIAKIVLAGLH